MIYNVILKLLMPRAVISIKCDLIVIAMPSSTMEDLKSSSLTPTAGDLSSPSTIPTRTSLGMTIIMSSPTTTTVW